MDIFELCGIKLSSIDEIKARGVIDWAVRNVILQRALDKSSEQELPYSLISIIEDSDCDTFGSIRLWLNKCDITLIDKPLTELAGLPDVEVREMFDGVCDKLKDLCTDPITNMFYIKQFSTLYGQYDYDSTSFKLSSDACGEIIDGAKTKIAERMDELGIGHQPI